jgi:hypothetical protein
MGAALFRPECHQDLNRGPGAAQFCSANTIAGRRCELDLLNEARETEHARASARQLFPLVIPLLLLWRSDGLGDQLVDAHIENHGDFPDQIEANALTSQFHVSDCCARYIQIGCQFLLSKLPLLPQHLDAQADLSIKTFPIKIHDENPRRKSC